MARPSSEIVVCWSHSLSMRCSSQQGPAAGDCRHRVVCSQFYFIFSVGFSMDLESVPQS